MNNLKASFQDVADWCEQHLEKKHGREIGMILGAVLRAYARLSTLPATLSGDERAAREHQLNARAEELLFEFSRRFFLAPEASKPRIEDARSMRTNMIYDPGPRPKD